MQHKINIDSVCLLVSTHLKKYETNFTISDFEEYKELTWSAMLHFKDEEFDKSLKDFQQAFKIIPDENGSDYFFASASALNLSKNKVAKELIIQAIKKTNASENYFDSFNEFNYFRDNEFFSEIKRNYTKYQSDFYKGLKHPQIY